MRENIPRRRQKFAAEYIKNGFNGVQAVYAAGYKQGYNSACVHASRLLRNGKVKAMVEKHLKTAELTAENVTKEIAKVAFGEAKTTGADKMKALDMASAILGLKKADQPQEPESVAHKKFIELEIKRLQLKHADNPFALDAEIVQLRQQFSDTDDPAYDPLLDYSKHPENWPPTGSTTESKSDAVN